MKILQASIQMKTEAEGGRHAPMSPGYCPHLVVQDHHDMIPVRLRSPDTEITPGSSRDVDFELMHYPMGIHDQLAEGVRFGIREGPREVGTGVVVTLKEQ